MGLLDGRIGVLTGASRGIGRAAARALAAEGAHVVALARTVGGLEELDDEIRADGRGGATLVPLDLGDVAAIDRLGGALHERWGRLDMLLGNAAILGTITPLAHLDPKVWERVMAINLTANWRLIRSLEPLLRQSPSGRAVFVTSSVARRNPAYWGAYATSKAALEALVRTWAAELRQTPVKANILDPGATRTRMRAEAMPGENPETLPPADWLAPMIVEMLAPGYAASGVIRDAKAERLAAG